MPHLFNTTLVGEDASSEGGVPFIAVPPAIVEALGRGRRPPVVVTVNGHSWRSTVAVYGGQFYLPANRANRAATGIEIGDRIEVSLELDAAPRDVELPPALAEALASDPAAAAAFEKLSFSNRREHVEAIASAKQEETLRRRLTRIVESLKKKG